MSAFIRSMACISAQKSFEENYFFDDGGQTTNAQVLRAVTPDYKSILPSAFLRRSGHLQKMGLGTALACLQNAQISCPDAIVTGTGTGCFDDTDKFLRSIAENNETTLSPTPFIQSTHNTVSGQIALLTKCQAYNFTYVHQNIAFESALLDALMLLKEGEAKNVLVGGFDELNDSLIQFLDLAGELKKENSGFIAGEGSAFFLLEDHESESSLAKIRAVKTIQKIQDGDDLMDQISDFLIFNKLEAPQLILSGVNGDTASDVALRKVHGIMQTPVASFKEFCGEYFTASAFALWLGVRILEKQKVPEKLLKASVKPSHIDHILIVNQFQNQQYSLQYISKC